ncbi:MAG: squalene/phytoene synthase family protein, partial [Rhodospirillales bacterium]|nr:squalene/phytoene synthase family protein [Rhodospirillales bacterium]
YCNRSAAPVGRYLVDLHHESSSTYPASDALCNALQVINHLQDCGDDYRNLNRVYIPQDWMTAANVDVSALADRRATEALRGVLDRCLDATDQLLVLAARLPSQLRDVRFAMETATIVAIARKLSLELRKRDPLAERVVLTKTQFVGCGVLGVSHAVYQRFPRWLNAAATRPSSVD